MVANNSRMDISESVGHFILSYNDRIIYSIPVYAYNNLSFY
jgi:hypothetical protein